MTHNWTPTTTTPVYSRAKKVNRAILKKNARFHNESTSASVHYWNSGGEKKIKAHSYYVRIYTRSVARAISAQAFPPPPFKILTYKIITGEKISRVTTNRTTKRIRRDDKKKKGIFSLDCLFLPRLSYIDPSPRLMGLLVEKKEEENGRHLYIYSRGAKGNISKRPKKEEKSKGAQDDDALSSVPHPFLFSSCY